MSCRAHERVCDARTPNTRDTCEPPWPDRVGRWLRRGLSCPSAVRSALVVAFVMWTRQSVSISADQLLQQALTAERAHPMTLADWEHPHFMPEDIGGPVGSAQGSEVVTVTRGAALSGIPAMLGRTIESAPVPSIQLLSVERVAAWRTSHACCTQDRVSPVRGGRLLLETTVPQGDLRKVELTVDAETYRVVREALVFHGIGRLEFEAVAPDVQSWAPTRKAGASRPSRLVSLATSWTEPSCMYDWCWARPDST
jgi:hypothetical protein